MCIGSDYRSQRSDNILVLLEKNGGGIVSVLFDVRNSYCDFKIISRGRVCIVN